MTSFPLPSLEWSGVVPDLDDGDTNYRWPPANVRDRIDRMKLYHNLFDGHVGLVTNYTSVSQNFFQAVPMRIAEELTSIEPEAPAPVDPFQLQDVCFDGVVHMFVYGGAILWTPPADETGPADVELLDPRYWAQTETGWLYVTPMSDPESGRVDRAVVLGQAGDVLFSDVREFSTAALGPIRERLFQVAYEDTVAVAPMNPRRGEWGTSQFDVMGAAVVELGRVYTTASNVGKKFESPPIALRGNKADLLGTAPPIDGGDEGLTYEQEQELINERLEQTGLDFEDSDVVFLPEEIQDAQALTWDAHLDAGFTQAQEMREMIQALTTVPGLFMTEQIAPASGVALRIVNRPFYSRSGSMQKRFIRAYRESSGVELTWPHPYSEDDEPGLVEAGA